MRQGAPGGSMDGSDYSSLFNQAMLGLVRRLNFCSPRPVTPGGAVLPPRVTAPELVPPPLIVSGTGRRLLK